VPNSDCLVEKLLPINRIHLVSGPSDVGKTSFWYMALTLWAAGLPLLGQKSYPIPWTLVSSERPLADVYDSIIRLGLMPRDFDILPAYGRHNKSLTDIWKELDERGTPRLVFWEGFDAVVKQRNNAHEVREFMSASTAHCEEDKYTILGSGGVAKMKPYEWYDDPRQMTAGSEIWGRLASTVFIMLKENPADLSDSHRLMHICIKNDKSCTVRGCFDENGILTFDDYGTKPSPLRVR